MNSFNVDTGQEVRIPSSINGAGKTYKIWPSEWGTGLHRRVYLTAYPPGQEGIKCGFICLNTGQKKLFSSPPWIAKLIDSQISFVKR